MVNHIPLNPHQITGRDFLASRTRALLADEPGVQKTRQAIAAVDKVKATSVLVICPAIARTHWAREFDKWSEGYRPAELRIISFADSDKPTSINRVTLDNPMWDTLIVDESHYAKNPLAKRTRSVFAKGGAAWLARRIWCLTGTPAPNNPAELWVMLRSFGVCNYEYEDFKEHFCVVDRMGFVRGTRKDNLPELRRMLDPIVLRRTFTEIMPEIGEIDVQELAVEPRRDFLKSVGPAEEALYVERTEKLRVALAECATDAEALQLLHPNRIAFATARRYMAMLKAPGVYDILNFELENGLLDKVVVFGYHVEALQMMFKKARHAGWWPQIITGATPEKDRYAAIDLFNAPGKSRIMFANIAAAGHVINLSAANQGIALELDWVPSMNSQAWMRMRRAPQTRPVSIRVAVCAGPDEIVSGVVARKSKDLLQLWSRENAK